MNGRPSIAREFFNSILAHDGYIDSVAMLRGMVNSTPPTVEDEHRDFKGGSEPKNGVASPLQDGAVRKIWSEALAGFATSGGGVLVWGLDARKLPNDTVDQVVGVNHVKDPEGFKSLLMKGQHQATDPPVPGVEIAAFEDSAKPGYGFVVCFVPESDYKPHRTEQGGKRWVMRIGESFVDVPPPVLRSLFFPQRRSYIILRTMANRYPNSNLPGSEMVIFKVAIENQGPATATELVVYAKPDSKGLRNNNLVNFSCAAELRDCATITWSISLAPRS